MSVAAAIERELTILNQRGLHARAAAKLCRLASGFDAEITVSRNEIDVSARSIMGLMLLAAAPGASIRVRAEGTEAAAAPARSPLPPKRGAVVSGGSMVRSPGSVRGPSRARRW